MLLVAGMAGLVSVLVPMLAFGAVPGLVPLLAFELIFGFFVGTFIHASWSMFVVALLWLAAQRKFPLRLMEFLDDAYRLRLLRIVGPAYQVRHVTLQDHLAPRKHSAVLMLSG
jgi:hypothetical protein